MSDESSAPPSASTDLIAGSPSVELSSNRTSLSFERTLLSADRTLMSIVRTALGLISFGFTIHQVFQELHKSEVIRLGTHAARNFGLALVLLGIALLIWGIFDHAHFRRELTKRRDRLSTLRLLRSDVEYKATSTFIVAIVLLLIGVAAAASIIFRSGIFG